MIKIIIFPPFILPPQALKPGYGPGSVKILSAIRLFCFEVHSVSRCSITSKILFYKSPLGALCKHFGGGQTWADTALTVLNMYFLLFRIFEQLALAPKNRGALNSLYWICIFYHSGFLSNFALALKNSVAQKFFTVLKYILWFKIFEQPVLALKNRVALKIFTVWNILFTFRCFEQLALALKNRVALDFFAVFNMYFYHSGFLNNLRLPWKNRGALEFFTASKYILSFRIFEQLALALKNRVCPENFHCIEYTCYIQEFWVTCACPEKQVPWNFSLYWICIFYYSGFLSNLRLPWKTELPWNFSLYWNIFYHRGFLSNSRLPWKQSLPWKFSSPGVGRPSASYAYSHHTGALIIWGKTKICKKHQTIETIG